MVDIVPFQAAAHALHLRHAPAVCSRRCSSSATRASLWRKSCLRPSACTADGSPRTPPLPRMCSAPTSLRPCPINVQDAADQ